MVIIHKRFQGNKKKWNEKKYEKTMTTKKIQKTKKNNPSKKFIIKNTLKKP